jgi:prevent-host-death family protein
VKNAGFEQKRIDRTSVTHYIGHMITTLRESKAKLSALVALAQAGEEVVITVRGKPKARLSAIREQSAAGMSGWKRELKSLHRKCSAGKRTAGSQAILNDLREERG